ncbi:choline-phosphate cytidylyltransferase [Entomortierella parvispora]|uniref:choline-phosphate cytidylyltransferase n=1 Tax=Entomortierella parvispora TaxID=205924 RepID=A0A9P3HC26_9FUNG|nr:choline-phosphate cytidylyltransferase [Entomortierella parvispora]
MSSKRKRTSATAASTKSSSTSTDASNHKQPRLSQRTSSPSSKDSARRRAAQERGDDDEDEDEANGDHRVRKGNNSDDDLSEDMDQDPEETRRENGAEDKPKSGEKERSRTSKSQRKGTATTDGTAKEVASSSSSSGSSTSSAPKYSYPINPPPVGRPVRIYCDGIYDLFHFGHAKALEQAKKAFPDVYLLVGVCDDNMTHSRKGKTVMTDKERYESVRHCKWVDEVVESAPWTVDQAFLDKHKIDYVAHDDIPYKSVDSDDVYAFVKKQGCFLPTNRTDGVSTSDLITRIVKDYDQYLRRNLERGVTAKELGIGFFKEQEVKLKKSAQDIRASIRQNWHGTKDELKNEISVLRNDLRQTMNIWEDKSQEFIKDFSRLFGADSVVNKIFRRRRHDRMITDGSMSSPSNGSSRMASPDSRDGSDDEDYGNRSPSSSTRDFFRFGRGSGFSMQRSRSNSSADSYDERSPRSESEDV